MKKMTQMKARATRKVKAEEARRYRALRTLVPKMQKMATSGEATVEHEVDADGLGGRRGDDDGDAALGDW